MAEKCPLDPGEHAIGKIPDYCYQHCEVLWDEAIKRDGGAYDYYDPDKFIEPDERYCNHEHHGISNSHSALDRPNETDLRYYSLVDLCEGCLVELGETSYRFNCSQNEADNSNL
jgi:hypothetical protein